MSKTKKHLKLPNGFGSIIFMGPYRRRPWAAKKTICGKQKIIGYAADYNEAMALLVNYNSGKTIANGVTFAACYHLWKSEHFPKVSKSTQTSYSASFKYCEKLYDVPMPMIKLADLQAIIISLRNKGLGYPSQKKVKVLMMQLYAYANKHDYVDKDYSIYVELDHYIRKIKKTPFCTRQLNRVRTLIKGNPIAATVFMLCYGGCRISEFLNIKIKDVKLAQRLYIIRDSKTAAGRNRIVPIHKKVLPMFQYFINRANETNSQWLISSDSGDFVSYSDYLKKWNTIMDLSHCHHTPHECRHTFATNMKNAGADSLATKLILGHSVSDITQGTYTHIQARALRKAVDRLK